MLVPHHSCFPCISPHSSSRNSCNHSILGYRLDDLKYSFASKARNSSFSIFWFKIDFKLKQFQIAFALGIKVTHFTTKSIYLLYIKTIIIPIEHVSSLLIPAHFSSPRQELNVTIMCMFEYQLEDLKNSLAPKATNSSFYIMCFRIWEYTMKFSKTLFPLLFKHSLPC